MVEKGWGSENIFQLAYIIHAHTFELDLREYFFSPWFHKINVYKKEESKKWLSYFFIAIAGIFFWLACVASETELGIELVVKTPQYMYINAVHIKNKIPFYFGLTREYSISPFENQLNYFFTVC